MVLKFYYDLMSQPCRALYLFLKATKIPYVDCSVALRKGEHLTDNFAKVNPFKKVPVVDHDGFVLTESVAIFRYLSQNFRDHVADHWYPTDSKLQARVDEYLAWQHLGLRASGSLYFQGKFLRPMFFNAEPLSPEKEEKLAKGLEATLFQMENFWLKGGKQPYLCGDKISIADLLGTCELEQPACIGYDVYKGRPYLKAWLERVRSDLGPHYDDAHKFNNKLKESFTSKM